MKLPKEQREAILQFLKENLRLQEGQPMGGFTDPNARRIELLLGKEVISYIEIDVVQRPEYDG